MVFREIIGPPEFIAWDEESDYFQVYGDNGTICTTDDADKAAAIAAALRVYAKVEETVRAMRA